MKFRAGLILLLLGLVLCTSLCGCTKKPEKTVIQFASWGSQSEIEIIKPILNEFEKQNPNIKVEFVHIPQNYFQKIHLLFASNLAPDVLFINNLYLPIYAKAGVLEELPIDDNNSAINQFDYIASVNISHQRKRLTLHNEIEKVFYKKSLTALSYNGKLYAIPRDISTLVIYYNKDLFNKYGAQYPNQYWKFSDFLSIAKKLTKDINNDGKIDIWGISFEEDLLYYLPYLMSEGGGAVSDDLKSIIINSQESKKGLEFYADLRNKYHVAPTKAESASETMAQLFLQEKLAMHLSGRWLVPKYRSQAKFNWDVVNFPSGDKGSIVPLDASGWAIAKSSKHKDAAMSLINYLSSKKSIEKFTKSGLIVPARMDVGEAEFLKLKTLPPYNERVFINVIKTAKPTPVTANYNEIQDKLKEKTEYLFN